MSENNNAIKLNNTSTGDTGSGRWNSTTPTSSVFSVGNANATNQDGKNNPHLEICNPYKPKQNTQVNDINYPTKAQVQEDNFLDDDMPN